MTHPCVTWLIHIFKAKSCDFFVREAKNEWVTPHMYEGCLPNEWGKYIKEAKIEMNDVTDLCAYILTERGLRPRCINVWHDSFICAGKKSQRGLKIKGGLFHEGLFWHSVKIWKPLANRALLLKETSLFWKIWKKFLYLTKMWALNCVLQKESVGTKFWFYKKKAISCCCMRHLFQQECVWVCAC